MNLGMKVRLLPSQHCNSLLLRLRKYMYFVYLLECADGSLYTGITTDVVRRLQEHQDGDGGHYTRSHGAKQILYTEQCVTRSSALRRELEIKKLNRAEKLQLVYNILYLIYFSFLKTRSSFKPNRSSIIASPRLSKNFPDP